MRRNPKLFLIDIVQAIGSIENFTQGISEEDFIKNDEKMSAVVRKLEIIGEAAKNFPERMKRNYPEIEWKVIAGSRDIIAHHYFGVDYKIVWDIIKKDIPKLKAQIGKILEEIGNE